MSQHPVPRPAPFQVGPRFTPGELARKLGLPTPTPEQAAVISAPIEPLLVVAGAGSGKTETMAARVLWLVANDYVQPEQVLGLTFTRKAAGELAHRVRLRLGQLRRLVGDDPLAGEPTVSTYHAYAARIVTEHGLRAGLEPSTRLLTEASCWQLVDTIVRGYTGDMSEVISMPKPPAPSTVAEAVLALSAELSEHLVEPDDLAAWTGRFYAAVRARPGRMYADVRDSLARQQLRLALLPLVRAYTQRKRDLEAMDFGDQMAWAAQVARDHPEVGEIERDRFRVVLLDEYQDTSHAQVVLLRSLYGGGHPVTAVGDPCQSIYGWRGASAGTLDRFPAEFGQFRLGAGAAPAGSADVQPATVLSLTTSWRNRPEILHVANALSTPLRRAGAQVPVLSAAHRVDRPVGAATVHCALLPTFRDEADWIADRLLGSWRDAAGRPDATPGEIPLTRRPTTAVLVRVRSQVPVIEAALRARGMPVEVVGLGGLLDTPEVRDVVCTLRVLADPTDGGALLRLLTGARWRIGPRDLVALHRRARAIALARMGPRDPDAEPEVVTDRLDEATLVEALADLGPPTGYSPAGYERFQAFAGELARLRPRLDRPLPDLVADVERLIGLEVEVGVRAAGRASGDAGLARGHLDALGDVAARFAAEAEGATLAGFLAFLAAAEEEERGLPPGEVDVVEGAVQVLTAHAAKGLEWEVVAVAGLTANSWPGPPRGSDHYLMGLGVLPFPLRGDRSGLPSFDPAGTDDQRQLAQARGAFDDAWRAHDEREERRLAYVAVTRARRLLLCSGFWWGDGVRRPRGPSAFLAEVHAQCAEGHGTVDTWTPEPPDGAENPTLADVAQAEWPADPLGPRRPALVEAAEMVERGLARLDPDHPESPDADDEVSRRWRTEADLLLAERAAVERGDAPLDVVLPGHLTVSQLVTLRGDPAALARSLRRPMPSRPDPYARRGTAFHRWLEQRLAGQLGASGRLLDVDELPGAADEDAAPDDELTQLQERFLASEWADRMPVEVEVPFATVIAGVVVRGRMDAVFADGAGGYDIVDWKTGRQPGDGAGSVAAVQLAAYRLAWAALAGVPVERVGAAFHYVRTGVTVRPADLLDAAGLADLVGAVPRG